VSSLETIRLDLDRLVAAREKLRRRPVAEILAALDELIARWLMPGSCWMARAQEVLAARAGLAPAMLRDGLPRLLEPLGGDAIGRLLDAELGRRDAGEAAPRLVAHILPGNVPALAASAICLSLAVRAAALVKPGAGEPWFAELFAASLAEVDADLGACVAVRYWAGGSADVESEIGARADAVDVSGGDDAVAVWRARTHGIFVGRGARLSFAAVGREVIADGAARVRTAQAIAEDISIWEQRGCLSPQVVFVESVAAADVDQTARALAAALDEYAQRWPPRPMSLDEKAAVLRFRQAAEWGLGDEPGARLVSGGAAWTILIERAAQLRPSCLHRAVRLQPIADLATLPLVVEPMRPWLEAAGLAVDSARLTALAADLGRAGVHRVCRAGEMQRPDLSWKPGGIARVASWLR